jgi:hypothetical protein
VSLLWGATEKCRKCKRKVYKQDVYRTWHNVDCLESILCGDWGFTWIKNWWLCGKCYKPAYAGETRFLDIDGFTYFLSWKFPFIRRG